MLTELVRTVPILRHPSAQPLPVDPAALSTPRLARLAARDGAHQFGTLGRGNHFLEIQADDRARLWIMVHTGSRAVGPAIQDHCEWEPLDAHSEEGAAYLRDVGWAERYAAHSRQRLLVEAAKGLAAVLGTRPEPDTYVDCSHNHVREEAHGGRTLWVHRKGAMPAALGECGLIPGSMGSPSFHVVGKGHRDALASSSHGAGRVMSRTEARQRLRRRDVRRQLGRVAYRDGPQLVEEAPGAYRDIGKVMRAQRELVRIVRRVQPLIVHKGTS